MNARVEDIAQRWFHVAAAAAIAVATVGVVTAFRKAPEDRRHTRSVAAAPLDVAVPRAPTYTELRERHGANRLRHGVALAAMEQIRPEITVAVPFDPAARLAATARRAERRAYDGAPPTVPHPIDQGAYPNCVACHERGLAVGNRTAPMLSHAVFSNCVQCHVVSQPPMPGDEPAGGPPLTSTFAGLGAPGLGERAWPGAPPTIPHSTLMRGNCTSCHGVLSAGLRSSHPWRQSCTQCHAPSSVLDQRPDLELPPPAAPLAEATR